jgi:glycine/D-amino acid oxidase-like deaminating enzyme
MADRVDAAPPGDGPDCRWERRPAITYATTDAGRSDLADELAAATEAGLDVELVDELDLPFPTSGGLVMADQAQIDPVAYLAGLVAEIDASPHAVLHEGSRVQAVKGRGPVEMSTGSGSVRAPVAVIATLLPFLDRGGLFARTRPVTSYIVALRADGPLPDGMYLSADAPSRSVRTACRGEEEILLVGGAGHVTGRTDSARERARELVAWARCHFTVQDVISEWSAHDYESADHLPFVGPLTPLEPNVLVATGFEKWGMTMGTAAALALSSQVVREGERNQGAFDREDDVRGDSPAATGGESPWWARTFDPARTGAALGRTATFNAEVMGELVKGWLNPDRDPDPDGAGEVVRRRMVPVSTRGEDAGPSDRDLTVVCTHLGGVCRWNDLDRTWDCPLHGSRFTSDGEVIAGPAVRPLKGSGGCQG